MVFGTFVLWKVLALLPLLPIAVPWFLAHSVFITLVQANYAFVGWMHLVETVYWGTCFFTKLVFFPFFPVIHFLVYPPAVIFGFVTKFFCSILIFFTFPVAYLLGIWHAFHKFHMHASATWLTFLKLMNC